MEPRPDALQVVFVAGNESAEQDPQLTSSGRPVRRRAAASSSTRSSAAATTTPLRAAGNGSRRARTASTRASTKRGRGRERRDTVDARLAALNDELNATYIAFGSAGERGRANQVAQDSNAAAMSPAAAASRTVAKAGALYRSEWDLVDAVQSGKALADIPAAELPAEMQAMEPDKREAYVREKASAAKTCSGRSASSPPSAAATSRSRTESTGTDGLDAAILEGIREVAATKGFSFVSK